LRLPPCYSQPSNPCPRRCLVPDQLARHDGRPFADQGEFVRSAEEHNLGLDGE